MPDREDGLLPTETTLVRGDRRVRFARLGEGPPLVLTHGYPENLQVYAELAPILAESFEVVAVDWPGLGASDPWPGSATPWDLSDRLIALLDHWNYDAAYLAGFDMGAEPLLVAAAEHPERVRGVTAMNSLVFPDGPTSWEIDLLRVLDCNRILLRYLPGLVLRQAESTFLPDGVDLDPALRREFARRFRRRAVREQVIRMATDYERTLGDLPPVYDRIDVPTLVLWGEQDHHFPPAQGRRLADRIPEAAFELVGGGEHWMVWHRADEVAERIAAAFG